MRKLLALCFALAFPLGYAPRARGEEGVNIRLDVSKELFHLHEPVRKIGQRGDPEITVHPSGFAQKADYDILSILRHRSPVLVLDR